MKAMTDNAATDSSAPPKPQIAYGALITHSVLLTLFYMITVFICTAGDWFDASYIYGTTNFLKDFANAMLMAGFMTGLYVAGQVLLARKYVVGLAKRYRQATILMFAIQALVIGIVVTRVAHDSVRDQLETLVRIKSGQNR